MDVYTGEKKHNIQSPEDRDSIIYQKGFSAGTEHSRSSPETIKKITQMSEDINNLKLGVQDVSKDVKYLIKSLDDHIKEESEYRKNQDIFHKEIMEKKANVWVEKVLVGVGSVVGVAVLGSLLGLILIK